MNCKLDSMSLFKASQKAFTISSGSIHLSPAYLHFRGAKILSSLNTQAQLKDRNKTPLLSMRPLSF
jgi:hypothetical protein